MFHVFRGPLLSPIPLWAITLITIVLPEHACMIAHAQVGATTTLSDRSDTVPDKLRLLSEAYSNKDYELAMALAESIKDTLTF